MKEKEIELSTEEIRYLLKGMIHWQDIEEKENPLMRNSAISRKQNESVSQKTAQDQKIEIKRSSETESHERSELNRVLLGDKQEISPHIFEGRPVVFLLATVGLLTVSTWAYFVFAG
ncbi:hypothetical protein [Desulfitobacterium metallireducens]|uniref:Uncharacterized protein n=1 Tax=Desulfitobacterium metallireducens DSM 15288 TaxID=871968 RepID=W0EH38_9FIRM|nr:hypothetical protein [Desulfitobacterium metallireducens]AHF08381.1 hypothetical protein DESME_01270 [Desulfitobacterium metallireducens DSM 15288]